MANKAKLAFGALERIDESLTNGIIDEYDLLFVKDADGNPYVGWIDSKGEKMIVGGNSDDVIVVEGESLPESGEVGKIYVLGEDAYIWSNDTFVNLGKSADLTALEAEIAAKADIEDVDAKISKAIAGMENYKVVDKPDGTLVDYREKEIRVMCPADIDWKLRASGEGADVNSYYIGVKAYAPDNAVGFKEDTAKTISDTTVYYFEGNEFAGIEANGRKYSIFWLPVAVYNSDSDTWTYHGANSANGKLVNN